jgi:hypothetical protein
MKRSLSITGAIAVAALVLGSAPRAHAVLSPTLAGCRQGVAKFSLKFFSKKMGLTQKCYAKNLAVPGICSLTGLATTINTVLKPALVAGIAKKCVGISATPLMDKLDYPGKCDDPDPSDGFTLTDLENCMVSSHEAAADRLLGIEYNVPGPITDKPTLKCQATIGKTALKYAAVKLASVQKCRNSVELGKSPLLGPDCATADVGAAAKIAKTETKTRAAIMAKCATPTQVVNLGICGDPECAAFCGTCNASCVADCIIATHGDAADDPAIDSADMIDFEYATAPVCGDQVRNQLDEECDGADNPCPGACGAPTGPFPCLCLDTVRERVIEHKEADLDNGWTGTSHDAGIVEGGGYVADLYDCDGPGGPDTLCTVGPSCSGAPHAPCQNDALCIFLGQGTCRIDRTAVGPHCNLDFHTACTGDGDCPGFSNFCLKQFHGPPLPLAAGSIQVCVLNIFSENVVGTKELVTGASAVRIRQRSITHLTGAATPCPVCGGFCQSSTPGNFAVRHICTTDADCADVPVVQHCVTTPVCSYGPNQDKACRPDPAFGGPTTLFGNPSVDCLPPPSNQIGDLDILFNPATTETVTMAPSFQCAQEPAFSGKTCAGGGNNGASCTVDSECPGATCSDQCFCAGTGLLHPRPNACDDACVGGGNDAAQCGVNSECPGGFCHPGDCREDLGAPPDLQPNEGGCTVTFEGHCSVHAARGCGVDADCQSPETCNITNKNCFLNSGIVRDGVEDPIDPVSASVFCIAATGDASVNATAGLPGPGALLQPTTVVDTGF